MDKKTGKIIKRISISIALLLIVGFAVNWYMTYRLESYLREKLSDKVAEATDNFYDVSFESLSIGLFSGELKVNHLSLAPNPTMFRQWQASDSLPQTYMNLHIQSIEFKGINLVWIRNYRSLRFDLFEIKSPIVKVFEVYHPNRPKKQGEKMQSKDLYEAVSPFFDVVGVKRMNLIDADIKYIIEDSISPSVYALENVNFFMYNFLLNENSDRSGKLLYCDNFEFSVEKRQTLLDTPQFLLNADTIRLSTIDSIVQIKGISLEPQDTLWIKTGRQPDDYISARLKSAEVKGIKFTRENYSNSLEARLFSIISSDIHYYAIKMPDSNDNDSIEAPKIRIDSMLQTWSLYGIISPLLNRVAIQSIGIDDTKFQYTETRGIYQDQYTLNSLNVITKGLLIDSLSDERNRFWHSESFELDAKDISGYLPSKNHTVNVGHIAISMQNKYLRVEDIKISPISKKTNLDYVSANVAMIGLDGFVISDGFEAAQLHIKSPTVTYTQVASPQKSTSEANSRREKNKNVFNIVSPFLSHLAIKNIKMSDADVTFDNRTANEKYKLHRLNVFMTDFLINKQTQQTSRYYFVCDNFGFSFKDFDNYLPGKDYRLKIQNTAFSYADGNLRLQNVKLIPQQKIINKNSGTYFDLETPLIETKGLAFDNLKKSFRLDALKMDSARFHIVKAGNKSIANVGVLLNNNTYSHAINSSSKEAKPKSSQGANNRKDNNEIRHSQAQYIDIKHITLNNPTVRYWDKKTNDSLFLFTNSMQVKNIVWAENKKTAIGTITIRNPHVILANNLSGDKAINAQTKDHKSTELFELLGESFNLNSLDITDLNLKISQPDTKINTVVDRIGLSGFNWQPSNSIFSLSAFYINRPSVDIHQQNKQQEREQKISAFANKDIYEVVSRYAKIASIGKFDITDATINYLHDFDKNKKTEQKINATNLGIEGLKIDTDKKSIELADITFNTKNLTIPASDGLYIFDVGGIDMSKKQSYLKIDRLRMTPTYPMLEFAYNNPQHKDWFDISAGNITLSGIDIPAYLNNRKVIAKNLNVSNVVLKNFKNQQIETPPRISPMIYEKLQKLPVKIAIDSTNIRNFTVVYDELAKNGKTPGRIFLTEMNGKIANLTNIPTKRNQYMRLDADGKLMGTGYFTAIWMIPADTLNDHFMLNAHLADFDLTELNPLIMPLAPAKIGSGYVRNLAFSASATSIGASIDMVLLYDSLQIIVYKDAETKTQNKTITQIANRFLKGSNPDRKGKPYRIAETVTERNPYRSTFNYFWQILQPAVVESVGVSQQKQNVAMKAGRFLTRVKSLFTFRRKKQKTVEISSYK